MPFKVSARTVLELGAELISSDAVAIFELVKNAIDAGSADGVAVNLCITLRHGDYIDALAKAADLTGRWPRNQTPGPADSQLFKELKDALQNRIVDDAPAQSRQALLNAISESDSPAALLDRLPSAYIESNWIEFRDSGCGMSSEDLLSAYLVIGTPSRRRFVDRAIAERKAKAPYLGEKGVGRLSAMRLGSSLRVETATIDDIYLNVLEVDWSLFEDLDKMVGDIDLQPMQGSIKSSPKWSGTNIEIRGIAANWSQKRLRKVAAFELARLTDPFTKQKRRFRIVLSFNGERIDIPRLDHAILKLAHAEVIGNYELADGKARLDVRMSCGDLGKGNPPEEKRVFLDSVDLKSITRDSDTDIPASALTSAGGFSFELYWYNRRLLRGVDSLGERKRVLELQSQWSGIMLFRDEFRVFPYGDDDDDWLGLDRKALASPGYKLNKAQFIGRVAISRIGNPRLIDQTNREGLKDCDEKTVLIEVLRFIVQDRLRSFLDEVDKNHRKVEVDFAADELRFDELDRRTKASLKALETRHADAGPQLRELHALFEEMQEYFAAARRKAEQIEDERDRMIQLAGVGLMLEVVAHELARSTEHTLKIIDDASKTNLPENVAMLFSTLRAEMRTMSRRLRVLDPLSVSGRQRKEDFNLVELTREIVSGHSAQFRRHRVTASIIAEKEIRIFGVRGMFVQIIENLIQNSIYWMDLRRLDEDDYKPTIEIKLGVKPVVLEYTDNGPGIQPTLADEVFKPFFSTKGKSRRQGLGLYIARDCAKHHDGQLYLSPDRRVHKGRLNTFVLELPKG